MIGQILREAWISITAYKMRSFLTMLGIIIGVCAVIVLVSVVQGSTNNITESIESLGANTISLTFTGKNSTKYVSHEEMQEFKDENKEYCHIDDHIYCLFHIEQSQKRDSEEDSILFCPQIVLVRINGICQILFRYREYLLAIMLYCLQADVFKAVQIGMIMIDIGYRRKIHSRQFILHYSEIREVRKEPIYDGSK